MQWPRTILVIFAGLLLTLQAHATTSSSPDSWLALEDPSGKLSLADVRSARLTADFKLIDSQRLRTAGNSSALWLRHTLAGSDELQYLQVIAPFLATLDLYVIQTGELLQHTQTGSQSVPATQSIPGRSFLLTLPQTSQPLTLYLRLSSPYTLRPIITLAPASQLLADDSRIVILASLLGALAMLALYNLIRFSYLRNAPSLWLASSQTTLLLSAMHLLGMVPGLAASPAALAESPRQSADTAVHVHHGGLLPQLHALAAIPPNNTAGTRRDDDCAGCVSAFAVSAG